MCAAQGRPGVYTNVLEHVGWIQNMVRGAAVGSCLTEVRTTWAESTAW
jgi:hypothetical protein